LPIGKNQKSPDFDEIRSLLKQPVVIDGRNLYDPILLRTLGIEYSGVGREALPPSNRRG
jgi:UDPglucose 6-dehydrogenase